MIRLMGSIVILSVSTIAGYTAARAKRRRLTFLEDMLITLNELKTEITLKNTPIPIAIEKCGHGMARNLLIGELNSIRGEDLRMYQCFLEGLSAESKDGISTNIEMYEARLLRLQTSENDEYKKASKLLKSGGILFGVLLVLILL